jgi:hypothetical protein
MSNFHNAEHAETAKKALDEKRVLEGENLESTFVDDAIHWVRVYGELIAFKERLLGDMGKSLPGLPAEAASEVRKVDMEITARQMERYKHRKSYWETRVEDLAGERREATR